MKLTRIYADTEGHSRFEDVEIPGTASQLGFLTDPASVDELFIRESPDGAPQGWHVAPRRQYVVLLSGHVEVEVSSGETRSFQAGDVLLAEDTFGQGHRTTPLKPGPRKSLFVTLKEAA